ncbi:MAG: bifunctional 2-C-methyl-D-erythritol 4-phosphate cytidylyltransferase/2-C-methyl-D-erythritol 2,4-cyclodiphosphate synthase [Alphaproteobacteria bacterium]
MIRTVALVLAAGRGVRAGGGIPKQYRSVAGEPMLRRTVRAFLDHPRIDAVRVVTDPADEAMYRDALAGLDLLEPVAGGATRQLSGRAGLESLAEHAPEKVLIHDAARPFVPASVIDRVLDALDGAPAAIAAMPVSDTIKKADAAGRVAGTVDRAGLWRAQTPQGFRYDAILAAHRQLAGMDLTDDAAVAEAAGLPVAIVLGSEENIKVTMPEDFTRMAPQQTQGMPMTRIGSGFDVHRFVPGDHIMLCGIKVPHSQGLGGHSDADVGLHALTDALLGAVAAGDIGHHFPPSDPQWRGADSARFLRHAADLVAAKGGRIVNVDVTIICERPKVGPHREAMCRRIAEILDLPVDRVSVKATTTERLGFTGREEGIAAQAVAAVAQ